MSPPGLTDEDLSFFDTHGSSSKPSVNSLHKSGGGNGSSLLDLDFGVPTRAPEKNNDDDDDFGDFVEFDEPLQPSNVPVDKASEAEEPTPVTATSESSTTRSRPLRFGQHLQQKPDGTVKPTSISKNKWDKIVAGTPVETPVEQAQAQAQAQAPRSSSSGAKLEDGDGEWGWGIEFDDEMDIEKEEQGSKNYNVTMGTVQLLEHLHTVSLPIIEQLLGELSQVSYPLRKRVLSQPKAKQFIAGYLEILSVAARIMAGRRRRTEDFREADREARQVERVWHEQLSSRMKAVVAASKIPELWAKTVLQNNDKDELCAVCGLSKTDFIKGFDKPKWGHHGHKSCFAWYNNL